jgi:phosphate-selective porin OprO/OprP
VSELSVAEQQGGVCVLALRPFFQINREKKSMRSLTKLLVLLIFLMAPVTVLLAQGTEPAGAGGSASAGATKAELDQLRGELAAQRQTIEELKAMVQKLTQQGTSSSSKDTAEITPVAASPEVQFQPVDSVNASSVRLSNAVLRATDPSMMVEQAPAPKAEAPKKEAPLAAGWNGEHFFIRSADGQFSISPYGYVDIDHRAYKGDGAPSDTFVIRRARFGFQGNYGSHFDYAILTDANATTGAIVRDVYLNVRIRPEFQIQAGQFKEPFAQETGIGATNLDFTERGLQSLLYPCAGTAYRCPGITLHGDISGGVVQWWAGAFNGRNGVAPNLTNEPEFVGRLRFYPFRKSKNDMFKQFAFGGSVEHSRARGLSSDLSFSGNLPDAAYDFFPSLRINGPIERYEGEFTYIRGPFAARGEYVQLQQQRYGIGSETPGGLGFLSAPGVGAKAWNGAVTYLLTGEKRPENGTPRVKHPLFGPDTPGGKGRGLGAWEVGVRYSGIQSKAPGVALTNPFTPGFIPTYNYHTDQVTFGVNWYVNYWVKYQFNVNLDQLRQPSVTGQIPQNFYSLTQELQFRF